MEKGSLLYSDGYNLKNSTRYQLSKKLMDELLLKWMAQAHNLKVVKILIEDCKKSNISFSTPNPLFSKQQSLSQSQAVNSFMPPMSPNSMSQSLYLSQKNSINFLSEPRREDKFSKDSKTFFKHIHAINYDLIEKGRLNKYDTQKKIEEPSSTTKTKVIIPQFYFPDGRINTDQIEKEDSLISKIFENTDEISNEEDFLQITVDLLGFPKMFNSLLFKKIDSEQKGSLSKNTFLKTFKENFQGKTQMRKFFNLIKLGHKEEYLIRAHFMPFMKTLLEHHPGLEFLKSHPDFQDKYSDTVIMRIFYCCDLNHDDKISFREFKKSNLMSYFYKVCEEPDINKVREYFSYEHFYVLYCKFWELDTNEHDFLINKDDFIKYDGHSLSRKAVDRIFQQIPRKFKSGLADIMNFEDFVWFMLSEEDKTTRTSIEYWFKVLDLDNNGIITPHEMNYFYEEQLHRLEYLGNESVNFNDMVCQLTDMLKPEKEFQFTIDNFLNNRHYSAVFFNSLLNLNKFLAFEQKDPFSKTEIDKNPEYTDWDKYAYYEYNKLTMEESQEQEQENSEIFDSNPANQGNNNNNAGGDNLDISVESANNNENDENDI